jgi:hypothetical protein
MLQSDSERESSHFRSYSPNVSIRVNEAPFMQLSSLALHKAKMQVDDITFYAKSDSFVLFASRFNQAVCPQGRLLRAKDGGDTCLSLIIFVIPNKEPDIWLRFLGRGTG